MAVHRPFSPKYSFNLYFYYVDKTLKNLSQFKNCLGCFEFLNILQSVVPCLAALLSCASKNDLFSGIVAEKLRHCINKVTGLSLPIDLTKYKF